MGAQIQPVFYFLFSINQNTFINNKRGTRKTYNNNQQTKESKANIKQEKGKLLDNPSDLGGKDKPQHQQLGSRKPKKIKSKDPKKSGFDKSILNKSRSCKKIRTKSTYPFQNSRP